MNIRSTKHFHTSSFFLSFSVFVFEVLTATRTTYSAPPTYQSDIHPHPLTLTPPHVLTAVTLPPSHGHTISCHSSQYIYYVTTHCLALTYCTVRYDDVMIKSRLQCTCSMTVCCPVCSKRRMKLVTVSPLCLLVVGRLTARMRCSCCMQYAHSLN